MTGTWLLWRHKVIWNLTIFVGPVSTCNLSTQKKGGELLSNQAVVFTVIFLIVATSSTCSFLQALCYSALSDWCSLVAAISHTNTHTRTLFYLNISLLHKCLQKTKFHFQWHFPCGTSSETPYVPASQQPQSFLSRVPLILFNFFYLIQVVQDNLLFS